MCEPAPTFGAGSHTTVRICPTVSRHCIKLRSSSSAGCRPIEGWGSHTHPLVTYKSYWSHSSYQSHTHPVGHTPIPLVTYPSIIWSHIHPTGHTLILLLTHPFSWSHTYPTRHTPILLVTHPSTGRTSILLVTYYSRPTGNTRILLVTHLSH